MRKERDEESEERWKKTLEILEHKTKERELRNELRMLREERTETENEMLRTCYCSFFIAHSSIHTCIEARGKVQQQEAKGQDT